LREHYITRDKRPFGSKTQAQFDTTCLVNLMHVDSCAVGDAVFFPAIASDDIEVPWSIKLLALTRRKPVTQKTQTARLAGIFATIVL
jgi:hypothetical protein